MSSDTGYGTESFSNSSDISKIQHGNEDFKSYENDGAELGVSEENQPYDNNVEPMLPEESDRIKSRCRISNNVISMISAAVLVGCAIVISMILPLCPCQIDLNIASTGEITCSFPNAVNTYMLIQKVSGDMQTFLVNGSEIIRHNDMQATNGFSATWSTDDTLNIKLVVGHLNCSHEGHYNISVTRNGTSTVYDVYLHVIDHPQTPVIAVASNGIIENTGGKISRWAMTGCNKAQLKFELSGSGNDIWDIWSETNEYVSTLINLGWETQFLTNIRTDQITYVDKRKFRCNYMYYREIYTSPALCIGIIPANFCQNDTQQCDHKHPYLCNKYISCQSQTMPLERPCSTETELHFLPDRSGCGGGCVWPFQSDCSYEDNCG